MLKIIELLRLTCLKPTFTENHGAHISKSDNFPKFIRFDVEKNSAVTKFLFLLHLMYIIYRITC